MNKRMEKEWVTRGDELKTKENPLTRHKAIAASGLPLFTFPRLP